MKKFLLLSLCVTSLVHGQNPTKEDDDYAKDLELLQKNYKDLDRLKNERVTNLMIFNDVLERYPRWTVPIESVLPYIGMGGKNDAGLSGLILALLDQQLTLCTKSMWATLQNLSIIWQRCVTLSDKTLLKDLVAGIGSQEEYTVETKKFLLRKPEKFLPEIQIVSQEIKRIHDSFGSILTKSIQEYSEKDKNLISSLFESLKENQIFADIIFAVLSFNIIVKNDYICKEVDDDFILFIPRSHVISGSTPAESDMLLGLSYSKLADFDYKEMLSDEEAEIIYHNAYTMEYYNTLGESLLKALKKLTIKQSRNLTASTGNFQIFSRVNQSGLLPFFNIYLDGHGSPDSMTAEISIIAPEPESGQPQKQSDFLNVLNFFNSSMRTKSLTIATCYPGGKKFVDTFDIQNQFSNIKLENIKYPIIFWGSFLQKTESNFSPELLLLDQLQIKKSATLRTETPMFSYKNYFALLDKQPAQYKAAVELMIKILRINHAEDSFKNFASIKLPNASWFIPIDEIRDPVEVSELNQAKDLQAESNLFGEMGDSLSISQIQALNKKTIKISGTDRVWLKANYIDSLVLVNCNDTSALPKILPMNYLNQNYFIKHYDMPEVNLKKEENSFHELMESFFFSSEFHEPINIVIKELKTEGQTFKDIYIFTHKAFKVATIVPSKNEEIYNGYVYTDASGSTKIVKWLNDYNAEYPEVAKEKAFDPNVLKRQIVKVEAAAKKDLKNYEVLAQVVTNKKTDLPERVAQSRKDYEAMQSTSKALELMRAVARTDQKTVKII